MDLRANTKIWRQSLGKLGEDIACDYLTDQGLEVACRNYRVARTGEIDIIARTQSQKLVFIEVKTRLGHPDESLHAGQLNVDYKKQKKIIGTAMHYLASNSAKSLQFDVVLIDYQVSRNHILALLAAADMQQLRKHAIVLHVQEAFGRFQ